MSYSLGFDDGKAVIVCMRCSTRSGTPHDVAHRFCARCEVFHNDGRPYLGAFAELGETHPLTDFLSALMEFELMFGASTFEWLKDHVRLNTRGFLLVIEARGDLHIGLQMMLFGGGSLHVFDPTDALRGDASMAVYDYPMHWGHALFAGLVLALRGGRGEPIAWYRRHNRDGATRQRVYGLHPERPDFDS